MARKVQLHQAMEALETIRATANEEQLDAIGVLEQDIFNRLDLRNEAADAELRACIAESKLARILKGANDGEVEE